MSAGSHGEYPGEPAITIVYSLAVLAPKFRAAVEASLAACHVGGLDAVVHESYRSQETQAVYYARGRTTVPPSRTVTNAASNLYSWHGFALAVDVISAAHGWDRPTAWFAEVASHFKVHDCKWGGDWAMKDLPHMYWGRCKDSPSDEARRLFREGGMTAVWHAVGAA